MRRGTYIMLFAAFAFALGCTENDAQQGQWADRKTRIRMALARECGSNEQCYVHVAKRDFKEGKYRFFLSGLMDNDSASNFYGCLAAAKNMDIIWAGDTGPFVAYTYDATMVALMRAQYGRTVFDSCLTLASRSCRLPWDGVFDNRLFDVIWGLPQVQAVVARVPRGEASAKLFPIVYRYRVGNTDYHWVKLMDANTGPGAVCLDFLVNHRWLDVLEVDKGGRVRKVANDDELQ